MTEQISQIDILDARVSISDIFTEVEEDVQIIAGDMHSDPVFREAFDLEDGDTLQEPKVLGLIVALDGEARIIWNEVHTQPGSVPDADHKRDVMMEARQAYAEAVNATFRAERQNVS